MTQLLTLSFPSSRSPQGADDVDGHVRDYIRSMVKRGVTRVQEMKVHMVKYVRTELFKDGPAPPHRKYFPTQRTIRDIMTQTRTEENFTKIDLANLVVRRLYCDLLLLV